ncbi:hypothetical protein HY639_00995 [Candidatus Woesearchaeota archaeon]|nr:hypothetical protein [Candidatus Woesearchaeota archaeon]
MAYSDLVQTLEYWGLSDVLVPFILVFTVVFAVLQNIKILPEKRFNVVVALAMALAVIVPHVTHSYPAQADVVDIINQSLPSVGLITVGIIMALLLIGTLGYKWEGTAVLNPMIAIAAFATVLFIFGRSAGWFPYGFFDWLDVYIAPETWTLFVAILIFGIIIYYIIGPEKKDEPGVWDKAAGVAKEMFGGMVKK